MDSIFIETANIIRRVLSKETTIRTAVYDSEIWQKRKLLVVACGTLKWKNQLEQILEDERVRPRLLTAPAVKGNWHLALVILYELVHGRGMRMLGRDLRPAARLVREAVTEIKSELAASANPVESAENISATLPRYARVNTLKSTLSAVVEQLAEEGFNVRTKVKPKKFTAKASSMEKKDVIVDPHVDNLLVFAPAIDLHNHPLVCNHVLILQDKASCLPAFLLNPEPGSVAFDACAAPGNKTSHMAAIMNNQGRIFATDLNDKRVNLLRSRMKEMDCSIVNVGKGDFLAIDPTDDRFSEVKYVIVDPPCSGSGIARRSDYLSVKDNEMSAQRLAKLHNLQVMLLKRAFAFPGVQRVVYSTCSIHEEENEQVVGEVVESQEFKEGGFEIVKALPTWQHRGAEGYDFSEKVLRADVKEDLTNGFFVAVFGKMEE